MTTNESSEPRLADIRHDDSCEVSVHDLPGPCHCARRGIAWCAGEALALMKTDQGWLPPNSPERVAWLARRDDYAARKRALVEYLKATE